MIHGRGDGHAGRHLVVEKSANFRAHQRCDLVVRRIVGTIFRRINTAGQVAFEMRHDLARLFDIVRDDNQRLVAERFFLKLTRHLKELVAANLQQSIGLRIAVAGAIDRGQPLGAGVAKRLNCRTE